MKLLHIPEREVEELLDSDLPPYAGKVGVYLGELNGIYVRVHPILEANFSAAAHRQKLDVTRSSGHPPFSHSPDVQCETAPSSGSGLDDSSSESGSEDSNSDNDRSLDEGNSHEGNPLDSNHELESMRLGLTQFAYNKCRTWMLSARYGVPPNDRLPPSKRARTASRRQTFLTYLEDDKDDRQLVVISHLDGYFHLACPFYVSNPRRYRQCLERHDLQSIEEVISHLRTHHAQPTYCPICRRVFSKPMDRDEHVRSRKCERHSSEYIDWVSKWQTSQLGKRDRLYLGEVKRWLQVWGTIFPKTKPGRSPYLNNGFEPDLSMIHDYWAGHGMDCISDYFKTHGQVHPQLLDEERALAALHRSVLAGLLRMALEKQGVDQKEDVISNSK